MPRPGLEPGPLSGLDFESSAATNYATEARAVFYGFLGGVALASTQNAVADGGAVARDSRQAPSVRCMPTTDTVESGWNSSRSQKVMLGLAEARANPPGYSVPLR